MKSRSFVALALLAVLPLAACGDDDDDDVDAAGTETSCDADALPLKTDGTLTVATGEPAFLPWVADDDPESGEGFEAALVYAVADELGIAAEDVTWVRTGFDEAIAPGPKEFDLNVQQYSITEERDEVVDFSDGYYEVEQAVIAAEDADIATAESIADLKGSQLGAAIGTTSLDYIEEVIEPEKEPLVFDDNAAAKASFDAGQVDGIVFDLPTAYYITAVEITDAAIIGVLPDSGDAEELGFLFEDGSDLVGCVNDALAALKADGTLESLEDEWLNSGGDIPTLSE
jgi:polar amino acid transport system substrate-binding protein